NVADDPACADTLARLKDRLAATRARVGDTCSESAEVEAIIREFWDYDDADRNAAVAIGRDYEEWRAGIERYVPGSNKHDK
ncbi:MAG: hypothetical protein AAGJ97_14855, partial [Planctomycetota bacterium]